MRIRNKSRFFYLAVLCICMSLMTFVRATVYTDDAVLIRASGSFTIRATLKPDVIDSKSPRSGNGRILEKTWTRQVGRVLAKVNRELQWYESYPDSHGSVILTRKKDFKMISFAYRVTVPSELLPEIERRIRSVAKLGRQTSKAGTIRFKTRISQRSAPLQ